MQRFVAAKEADIAKLMAEDEEEDIKAFYLEQARDCIVSLDRFSHLQCRALMVVESALILRPQQTLAFLVSVNYADAYMNSFVTYLDAHESFLATHLALLSLAALFTVPLEALPASYRAQLPLLFMTCLQLMAQLQPLKKQREEAKDEDVDYDDLMDRLNGQNFKQNDWGYAEDCDVMSDDAFDDMDLKHLEEMGCMEGDCTEIDDHLINEVTIIDEVAFLQQAFNVRVRRWCEA